MRCIGTPIPSSVSIKSHLPNQPPQTTNPPHFTNMAHTTTNEPVDTCGIQDCMLESGVTVGVPLVPSSIPPSERLRGVPSIGGAERNWSPPPRAGEELARLGEASPGRPRPRTRDLRRRVASLSMEPGVPGTVGRGGASLAPTVPRRGWFGLVLEMKLWVTTGLALAVQTRCRHRRLPILTSYLGGLESY